MLAGLAGQMAEFSFWRSQRFERIERPNISFPGVRKIIYGRLLKRLLG
jgi:hypothetical protein